MTSCRRGALQGVIQDWGSDLLGLLQRATEAARGRLCKIRRIRWALVAWIASILDAGGVLAIRISVQAEASARAGVGCESGNEHAERHAATGRAGRCWPPLPKAKARRPELMRGTTSMVWRDWRFLR